MGGPTIGVFEDDWKRREAQQQVFSTLIATALAAMDAHVHR